MTHKVVEWSPERIQRLRFPLTQEEFAAKLTEVKGRRVTAQSVSLWETSAVYPGGTNCIALERLEQEASDGRV